MKLSLIVLLTSFALACATTNVPVPEPPIPARSLAARGEYIVRHASVCGHCHAAGRENPDGPLSGGIEFRNWRIGTARGSNLTPDPETGLGTWSAGEIMRALRNGVRKDGRLLVPVMPYEWYHLMSDDDALAVAEYLKTLPPVRNEVKQNPNLWFKIGRALFLRPRPAVAATAPPRGATAEYGGYLSQHVALCADCHTQRRGMLQTPDRKRLFAGMTKPPEGFPAHPSNLTPDPETGIGRWSEEDFFRAMRTGVTPDGRKLHPFMPWQQTGRMTDDDLRAIWRYLRALPPIRNRVPRPPAQ